MQIYFYLNRIRNIYYHYLIFSAVILFLVWPGQPFYYYLDFNRHPMSFQIMSIATLIILSFYSIRLGAQMYSHEDFHTMPEWLNLSPITAVTLLRGKILLSFFHTLFFLALSLPFLLASLSISGLSLSELYFSLLVLFTVTLTCRIIGLLLAAILTELSFLLELSLMLSLIILYIPPISLLPQASVITILLNVGRSSFSPAAVLFSVLFLIMIILIRVRFYFIILKYKKDTL
ncbi:MAG: hypothetical protein GH155_07465 [Spirochaeta sp.]|nr:hypothetical protein [Spirochaeta sp.]